MTPSSPRTTPSTPLPRARKRRVKRGIVAGYIHDISPRHRGASESVKASAPSIPVPARLELEPSQA